MLGFSFQSILRVFDAISEHQYSLEMVKKVHKYTVGPSIK